MREDESAPFHDLRLRDPMVDPAWVTRFETWMQERGVSAWTKRQYIATLSQMFALARRPDHQKQTGVTMNPWDGVPRPKGRRRSFVLTREDARAILAAASYHIRLAVAIGALAPKLRRTNILRLEWAKHLDPAFRYITIVEHKTAEGPPFFSSLGERVRGGLKHPLREFPRA